MTRVMTVFWTTREVTERISRMGTPAPCKVPNTRANLAIDARNTSGPNTGRFSLNRSQRNRPASVSMNFRNARVTSIRPPSR